MSYANEYAAEDLFVRDAALEERAAFLRRTYLHLVGAVLGFMLLEGLFLTTPAIYQPILSLVGGNWWIALIAFLIVSWVAQSWAHNSVSPGKQYAGLILFTFAEAVIFVPLLFMAKTFGPPNVIPTAGLITLMIFGGLTTIVFVTKSDFSFLRNVLWLGAIAALAIIIAGAIFNFTLGLFFSGAMVVLFSGFILYDTSNVLHHYRTDQHVGAALELFASVAMLFWYVLQLAMMLGGDD